MYLLLSFVPPLEFVFVIQFYFIFCPRLSVYVHLLLCSVILGKPYKSIVMSNNNNDNIHTQSTVNPEILAMI